MTLRARAPEWGSDVVAQLLRAFRVPYVALTPGSSFRGLHDSLVNYLGNQRPEIVLCNHEEIAVALAHGYAKVTAQPMAAAVHANVGLQHAAMAVFCAYADRQPVLVLGGNGPMDSTRRRPWIDWVHTTHGLGTFVRDITRWEHQPASVGALPEAMMRAWHALHGPPPGPVYLGLDVSIQEERLGTDAGLSVPDLTRFPVPGPISPDPTLVDEAAAWLVEAAFPVILLGRGVPTEKSWLHRIALAEALAAAVLPDPRSPISFPTSHPLVQAWQTALPVERSAAEIMRRADVVVSLNHVDPAGTMRAAGSAATPTLIHISVDPLALRSGTQDQQQLPPANLPILADADSTLPLLLEAVRRRIRDRPAAQRTVAARAREHRHQKVRVERRWRAAHGSAQRNGALQLAQVARSLRDAFDVRARDVVVARAPADWPVDLWPFERPLAYLGGDGGAGVGSGPGIAVGAALAARDLDRPVVAVLGDGDMLMAVQALWTAAHHGIPLLIVVVNNQTYHNDEVHQAQIARDRDRPVENRWIGQRMTEPAIDFATLAGTLGVDGIGPVAEPAQLTTAFKRAIDTVDAGGVALVDVRVYVR